MYVIQNERKKIYIGQTNNLEGRLQRHNGILSSKGRSYTKINKGQWKIVYKEKVGSRQVATQREKYLKSHVGRNWLREYVRGL